VRLCDRVPHIGDPQSNSCFNLNNFHRLSRVLTVAVCLVSLPLLSPLLLGQTSDEAVEPGLSWSPRGSDIDESRGHTPSPRVVSVSRLRVPAKAVSHLETAQARFAKMQLAQATVEIDRAIEIYPGFAQAFRMKALVSLAQKDFTGSVESAAHAISLDVADAYSWVALATGYNSLNEWPEAEAAAARAVSLDSSVWQGRLELAKSFYGEARYGLALYTLDQLNRDIPDVHLVRANLLMRLGRPQEAAQQFAVFLREVPGDSRGDQIRQILLRVPSASSQLDEFFRRP